MDKEYLVLKRASASRSSGEWNDDDFDDMQTLYALITGFLGGVLGALASGGALGC
jgi:hypothetical protein